MELLSKRGATTSARSSSEEILRRNLRLASSVPRAVMWMPAFLARFA